MRQPIHYKGETWYLVKVSGSKRYYRNRLSDLQLTINLKNFTWRIKRLMPKVRRYGNVPDAWCKSLPERWV